MDILLSIITVSYNSRKTIIKTFESVAAIKNSSIEYIVVDGGSKDGTIEIAENFKGIIDYFHTGRDKGIYDAMNHGLNAAKGKYCLFLNSDDFLDQQGINHALEVVAKSDLDWCYGKVRVVSEFEEKPIGIIDPDPLYLNSSHIMFMPVAHPATIMKTKNLQQLGGFNLQFGASSDYELVIRYLKQFGSGIKIEAIISNYRLGGVSALPNFKKIKEHWKIWTSFNYPFGRKVLRFFRDLVSLFINRYFGKLAALLRSLRGKQYIAPLK